MNGLMLYRQFLENIRDSIDNYDLNKLEAKDYLSILSRVNEIEDMTYIDVILKNAGLDLSFISNDDFLHTPVELKSKLGEVICNEEIFEEEIGEEMQEAYSDYLNNFVSSEDDIISKIDEILVEKGLSDLDSEMLPQSGSKVLSTSELLEKNKETLSALFSGMSAFSKTIEDSKEVEEEIEDLDELEFDEDIEIEELENTEEIEEIDETEETEETEEVDETEEIDEFDEVEDFEGSIELNEVEEELDIELKQEDIVVEDKKVHSKKLNTSFLDDDFEEDEEDIEEDTNNKLSNNSTVDNFDTEEYEDTFEDKEFSMFLEEEMEEETEEDVLDDNNEIDTFDSSDIEEDNDNDNEISIEDIIKGRDLDTEVSRMYSLNEKEDTDPVEGNPFREASEYFLNGGKKVKREKENKENLKKLYKNKEKIVDIEGVNDLDDALAKFLLAVGDGVLNLPSNTSNLFQKLKKNGKKMYGNMVVEDDADEEE